MWRNEVRVFILLLIVVFFINCPREDDPCDMSFLLPDNPKQQKDRKQCQRRLKYIYLLNLIELNQIAETTKEPEPNGSFEEAKCLVERIDKYSGTSDSFVDYRLYIDNSNGQKDLDHFFVYSKSNTVKLLRQYPLSDISIEIYSGKESRKLLSPKTSQFIEYQNTSTTSPDKETRLLEEYDLGGEPYIYYKFASQSLTDAQRYYILLPSEFPSYKETIGKNTFLFQGEFSCSP